MLILCVALRSAVILPAAAFVSGGISAAGFKRTALLVFVTPGVSVLLRNLVFFLNTVLMRFLRFGFLFFGRGFGRIQNFFRCRHHFTNSAGFSFSSLTSGITLAGDFLFFSLSFAFGFSLFGCFCLFRGFAAGSSLFGVSCAFRGFSFFSFELFLSRFFSFLTRFALSFLTSACSRFFHFFARSFLLFGNRFCGFFTSLADHFRVLHKDMTPSHFNLNSVAAVSGLSDHGFFAFGQRNLALSGLFAAARNLKGGNQFLFFRVTDLIIRFGLCQSRFFKLLKQDADGHLKGLG